MPRYYKDKIYTNPHLKAMVQQKSLAYTLKNPQDSCPIQHERLLKKLQRKMK